MSKLKQGYPHIDSRSTRERIIERLDLAISTARVDLAMVILSPYEAEAILAALRGDGPVPKGAERDTLKARVAWLEEAKECLDGHYHRAQPWDAWYLAWLAREPKEPE